MVVASLIVFIKVEVIASFLPPIPLLGSRASLGWSCYCSLIKMKGASSLLAMEDGRPPAFQKLLLLSLPARKIEIPSFLQDSTEKAAHRRPSKSKDQRLQRNTLQTRLFVFFVGHVLIVASLASLVEKCGFFPVLWFSYLRFTVSFDIDITGCSNKFWMWYILGEIQNHLKS